MVFLWGIGSQDRVAHNITDGGGGVHHPRK